MNNSNYSLLRRVFYFRIIPDLVTIEGLFLTNVRSLSQRTMSLNQIINFMMPNRENV